MAGVVVWPRRLFGDGDCWSGGCLVVEVVWWRRLLERRLFGDRGKFFKNTKINAWGKSKLTFFTNKQTNKQTFKNMPFRRPKGALSVVCQYLGNMYTRPQMNELRLLLYLLVAEGLQGQGPKDRKAFDLQNNRGWHHWEKEQIKSVCKLYVLEMTKKTANSPADCFDRHLGKSIALFRPIL